MRMNVVLVVSLPLAVGAFAGCSSSPTPAKVIPVVDSASLPPAAGGTGAFGITTVGGKQKMYLPQTVPNAAGHMTIAVVDVGVAGSGVAGAPAQVASIDLGGTDYATATGGDSSVVIAVSTASPTIWFIDPTTDTLVGTTTLDATYGTSGFSGGGGFVTGVAIDAANHRAVLSVWNGFALVDLASRQITSVIQAPPSENFGFDSVHERVLAPFYDCTSSSSPDGGTPGACTTPLAPDGTTVMTDGLNVIDLTTSTVFTYEDPGAVDPTNPVGIEPDSAAIDPNTGIAVVPSEGEGSQNIIDFSRATFDSAKKTVTAPHQVIAGIPMTGVAVEPSQHIAFWEEEHGTDIGVASLTQANAGNVGWVHGQMPAHPQSNGAAIFSNLGDPHGIAVTTALTSGGPVGFVVDSQLQWVARIDLAGLLAAEMPDADTELTDTQTAPFVTYLDALTKE
jgi:hypothetical protein